MIDKEVFYILVGQLSEDCLTAAKGNRAKGEQLLQQKLSDRMNGDAEFASAFLRFMAEQGVSDAVASMRRESFRAIDGKIAQE